MLHATDLSSDHFSIAQRAADIATKFDAKLYLLHVIEPPATLQLAQGIGFAEFDSPKRIKDDARTVLATLGEALSIPVEQQIVAVGPLKTKILETVNEFDCGLIITGKNTSLLPTLLQDIVTFILKESKCDVMVLDNQ